MAENETTEPDWSDPSFDPMKYVRGLADDSGWWHAGEDESTRCTFLRPDTQRQCMRLVHGDRNHIWENGYGGVMVWRDPMPEDAPEPIPGDVASAAGSAEE